VNLPSFVFTTPFCFPSLRNWRGRTTGRKWWRPWRPWRSRGCHSAIDVVLGDLISGILFFELKNNLRGGGLPYMRGTNPGAVISPQYGVGWVA